MNLESVSKTDVPLDGWELRNCLFDVNTTLCNYMKILWLDNPLLEDGLSFLEYEVCCRAAWGRPDRKACVVWSKLQGLYKS